MSKYRNWWHPNVVQVIRAYPQLRARKDALQGQSMTANYSASPRAGGASRTAENVALRALAPAEGDALSAVEQAIALVALQPDGDKVLRLIRRYYWGYGEGFLLIAELVGLSEKTARRRNAQFIRYVAYNLHLL